VLKNLLSAGIIMKMLTSIKIYLEYFFIVVPLMFVLYIAIRWFGADDPFEDMQ